MTSMRVHYDRVAAVVAALFVLGSALGILGSISRLDQDFLATPAPPPRKAAPPAKAVEMEEAIATLRRPAQWTFNGRSGLFVPEKHFIDPNGLPATLQSADIHPPVPNEWLERFDLPVVEADVLRQDPDADGFSNLEEWQYHTDPTNKDSHPAFIAKLKIKSSAQEPFHLVFASWVNDTFALNSSDLKEPTQFLKIGDVIRGTKFRLVRFREKYETNRYGTKVDVSELHLENWETRERVTLVKEKAMVSPEVVANFVYLWGTRLEFAVRKDHEFSLKPERQVKYKLVDVYPDKAVVVNIQKPNEAIEVGPLNP